MKAKVDAIASHGITCFLNRQLIYNYPESLLTEKGIMCIEHADFEGVERLSLVTGGEIASTFDRPDLVKLGHCDAIEEIMIGEDKVCATPSEHQHEGPNGAIRISSSNSPESPLVRRVLWCCEGLQLRWSMRRNAHCTTLFQFSLKR